MVVRQVHLKIHAGSEWARYFSFVAGLEPDMRMPLGIHSDSRWSAALFHSHYPSSCLFLLPKRNYLELKQLCTFDDTYKIFIITQRTSEPYENYSEKQECDQHALACILSCYHLSRVEFLNPAGITFLSSWFLSPRLFAFSVHFEEETRARAEKKPIVLALRNLEGSDVDVFRFGCA